MVGASAFVARQLTWHEGVPDPPPPTWDVSGLGPWWGTVPRLLPTSAFRFKRRVCCGLARGDNAHPLRLWPVALLLALPPRSPTSATGETGTVPVRTLTSTSRHSKGTAWTSSRWRSRAHSLATTMSVMREYYALWYPRRSYARMVVLVLLSNKNRENRTFAPRMGCQGAGWVR